MAKMYFAKTVRYLGERYTPNTVFEVRDEDISDLRASGGWLVEEPQPVRLIQEEPTEEPVKEEDKPEPTEEPKDEPTEEPSKDVTEEESEEELEGESTKEPEGESIEEPKEDVVVMAPKKSNKKKN